MEAVGLPGQALAVEGEGSTVSAGTVAPVLSVWSPTRTLHPLRGNFRVGGDSPGTMDCGFQALNERIGDNALVESAPRS